MKHTPGPWIAGSVVTDAQCQGIAQMMLTKDDTEIFANANLVAAAPELLDAAIAAAALIRGSGFTEGTKALVQLNAAIAKARRGNHERQEKRASVSD